MTEKRLDSVKVLLKNPNDSVVFAGLEDLIDYYVEVNRDSAFRFANLMLKNATARQKWFWQVRGNHALAMLYELGKQYVNAYQCDYNAQKISESKNYARGTIISSIHIGSSYLGVGNYPRAIEHFLVARRKAEAENNIKLLGTIDSFIGQAYTELNDCTQSTKYYTQSLAYARQLNYDELVLTNVNNLCRCTLDQKNYRQVKQYLDEAISIIDKHDFKYYKAEALQTYAVMYFETGDTDKALSYATQSLEGSLALKNDDGVMSAYRYLAKLYYEVKKYMPAIACNERALALAEKFNDYEEKRLVTSQLSHCYEATGNLAMALKYSKEHIVCKDSLLSFNKFSKLNKIETSYALEREQVKIDQLEKEAQLKTEIANEQSLKIRYLILSVGLLVSSGGLLFVRFRQKSKWANSLADKNKTIENQNRDIKEKSEVIESINLHLQEKALRAQMNPHFVFNSLTSIQHLIVQQDTSNAFHYLSKFASLLRAVLNNSDKPYVAITDEIEMLELYLQLESLRFDNSFDYKIESGAISDKSVAIPPMMIQPFVENAVVHGLFHKNGERKLSIYFSQEGKKILCEIIDNGIGREASSRLKLKKEKFYESWGVKLTEQRLATRNNLMMQHSSYSIKDLYDEKGNSSGTRITLTFDYV